MGEPLTNRFERIVSNSKFAVAHIDLGVAGDVIGEINNLLSSPEANNLSSTMRSDIDKIRIAMQIVDFPTLADNEAYNIISNHLLEFFVYDIPIEDRVVARYHFSGYDNKNAIRKSLKEAISKNNQPIGNMPISEWIKRFEKKYESDEINKNIILDFLSNEPEARNLSETNKYILKSILWNYVNLLSQDLMDKYDVAETLGVIKKIESGEHVEEKETVPAYAPQNKFEQPGQSTEIIRLSEGVKKYPELGEQLITSNYIRLKMFPEPVRPSLKNWITDYTFNLGHGTHDTMMRGSYLFHAENTKSLSSSDRERLGYVLKALDENMTVELGANTKQLIFPKMESPSVQKPAAPNVVKIEERPRPQPRNIVDLRE